MTIQVGETIPSGTFKYVPWTEELETGLVCGVGSQITTDAWKGKKVVVVSVPGAFTPGCHVNHLPPYLQKYDQLKAKGVDEVYILAANDMWVMSGWGVTQGLRDKIIPISDTYAEWSAKMGLSVDLTEGGMGVRSSRYALILDDLKVVAVEKEPGRGVTVSGVDNILTKL